MQWVLDLDKLMVKAVRKKAQILWGFKRTNQPTFALFPSLSLVNDGVILESVAVGWWAVTITQADDEGSESSRDSHKGERN